jgi:hypothetical protein
MDMGWNDVSTIWSSSAPFLASLFALSFPMIFVWALTFLMVTLCEEFLDGIEYVRNKEFVWMVVLG